MNIFIFFAGDENKKKEIFTYWKSIFSQEKYNLILGPSEDDNNFLIENYEYYKQALIQKKYALMADVWRLYIIEKYKAGFYIDGTKKVELKKIDELLSHFKEKNKIVLLREDKYYVNPFFIYSNGNNDIFKKTLERYKRYKNINNNLMKIELIPLQLTYTLKENKDFKFTWNYFENEKFIIYPLNFVDPNSINSIIKGYFCASWKRKQSKNKWEKTFLKYAKNKHKSLFVGIYMFLWWKANWLLNIILFFTSWKHLKRNLSLKK